ncbi:hypothetical protein AB0K60_32185 [Thermopolyspora sp. NPDC052614]|uniref:hypothetical protein n=1 Tax=Thermopolyspora sp. NPDC052614 TaxID=3155682 RepID=UPI00341398D6
MFRITVIIAVIAVVTGCSVSGGGSTDDVSQPAMTKSQALARIEQLIQATASELNPKPRLELYRPSLNESSCPDATGDDSSRVVISRAYYLRDIPSEQNSQVSEQVQQHWQQQGHLIEGVSRNGFNIAGRSRPDDFLLALDRTGEGALMLGVTSPCVSASEDPTATPHP